MKDIQSILSRYPILPPLLCIHKYTSLLFIARLSNSLEELRYANIYRAAIKTCIVNIESSLV